MSLAVLLLSSNLLAFNVKLVGATSGSKVKCEAPRDLNKTEYQINSFALESNGFDDVNLSFNIKFRFCTVENGQYKMQENEIGEMVAKKYPTVLDNGAIDTSVKFYEQITASEVYVVRNHHQVLSKGVVQNKRVTLGLDITQYLSDDQIIDSINGEPQRFKISVAPRPIIELYDINKSFIDRRNYLWQKIDLELELEMLPTGI